MRRAALVASIGLGLAAFALATAHADEEKTLAFDTPTWKAAAAKGGPMGPKAAYDLDAAEGDKEGAKATLHHFGSMAGSFDANLERWCGQFEDAEGKKLDPKNVKVERFEANGVKVAMVELAGTYNQPTFGMGKAEPKPGSKMIACYVEGPDGPWFARLVGPAKTVDKHKADFEKWVKSVKLVDKK